jgi:predicted DNA-binding transcriptional regulator AlpA
MALIPPRAVQQQYGIPANMLAAWRRQGVGPEYFTLGPRSIRYYPGDIDDWITHQNRYQYIRENQDVLAGNSGGRQCAR